MTSLKAWGSGHNGWNSSVLEKFIAPKSAQHANLCEDRVVVTADFAAVIDGMTSPTVGGARRPGALSAQAIADVIQQLPAEADALTAVQEMTEAVRPFAEEWRQDGLVGAVFACVSFRRREIWRVGDCGIRAGQYVSQPTKRIDTLTTELRVALIEAQLAADPELLNYDAEAVSLALAPFYREQKKLGNYSSEFGYPVIDGVRVPADIEIISERVLHGNELILTTDGYPVIGESLQQSEDILWSMLGADPWCIGALRSMGKSPRVRGDAPDDRTYLRLRLD